MSLDSLKQSYRAGREMWRNFPVWVLVLCPVLVGIIDVSKALNGHDRGDAIVAAVLWWCIIPPIWVWWIRKK